VHIDDNCSDVVQESGGPSVRIVVGECELD
jgi:hypothetical protein